MCEAEAGVARPRPQLHLRLHVDARRTKSTIGTLGRMSFVRDRLSIFQTLNQMSQRHFTAVDRMISRRMSRYGVKLVKTGNPNGAGLPVWPRLSAQVAARAARRARRAKESDRGAARAMRAFIAHDGRVRPFQ